MQQDANVPYHNLGNYYNFNPYFNGYSNAT